MKTREVVRLISQEVAPVSEATVLQWAVRHLEAAGPGHPREWSEREILALYVHRSVAEIGGGRFQERATRAILLGLPLAGAIWSNGARFLACEPEEASQLVFEKGGWALPIGKWRMKVRRWMLRMGSPKAPQNGWDDIVREALEEQEIEKAIQRHPSNFEVEHER